MILDGKKLAEEILENIKTEILEEKERNNFEQIPCKLVVVTVGDDAASKVYVRNKQKACEKVGIQFKQVHFSENECFSNILNELKYLNSCKDVAGIIIQLPIVSNVLTKEEKDCLTKSIYGSKDVDGFTPYSEFDPCTPKGIMRLLDSIPDYDLSGKSVLVIGRSDIVGKPVAKMLLDRNCTVTIAHSKTKYADLLDLFNRSEIVISAVGKNDVIGWQSEADYGKFSDGKVIIDVGINRNELGTLRGDFGELFKANFSNYYTPVPGGVGPMTVAMLIENTWESYKKLHNIYFPF